MNASASNPAASTFLRASASSVGHRVIYREAHVLIEEIADAGLDGGEDSTSPTSRPSRC
jgi:hypothetical protein